MKKQTKRTKRNEKIVQRFREPSIEQQYEDMERKNATLVAEKLALRRIEVTGGDETALGCKSSGWVDYRELLIRKLRGLEGNKVTKADQASRILNITGFKTGSGQSWTPRLINVAKILLLGQMTDRVVDRTRSKTGVRTKRSPPQN